MISRDDTGRIHITDMKGWGEDKQSGRVNHQKVTYNGIEFDSIVEYERYLELLLLQRAGKVTDIEVHPSWPLIPTQRVPGKPTFRGHKYTADFKYKRDGIEIVEDVKSEHTRKEKDYIINRKLMWMLLGIYVEEVVR